MKHFIKHAPEEVKETGSLESVGSWGIEPQRPSMYNAALELTGKVRGAHSTAKQSGYKNDLESEVFSVCLHSEWSEEELSAPFAYTVLTLILLGLSLIGLGVAYDLFYFRDAAYDFIYLDREFPAMPAYLMFCACGLGIFAGFVGLLIIFCRWPSLLHIFHQSLWMISSLNLLAAVYALGIQTEPTAGVYHRLFEASTLAMMNNFTYIDIWGQEYRFIWDMIQTELRCCGVIDPEDWLRSPLRRIPKSCCSRYHTQQCESHLQIWNDVPEQSRKYEDISSALHLEGCLSSVRIEWKAMRWDWIVYPMIIFLFHSLTSINLNLLTNTLESQFRTVTGRNILKDFRASTKSRMMALCCCPCNILSMIMHKFQSTTNNKHLGDMNSGLVTLHKSTYQNLDGSDTSLSQANTDTGSGSSGRKRKLNSIEVYNK